MVIGHFHEHTVELFRDIEPEREKFEGDLVAADVPCPLPHRTGWVRTRRPTGSWFLAVRDAEGKGCCGFAIDVVSSRALPRYRVLRVERFGQARTQEAQQIGLWGLVRLTETDPRILRIDLQVVSRNPAVRDTISGTLVGLGFRQEQSPRFYRDTIVVDLKPPEASIFASLHPTARRHVRALKKNPVALGLITDPTYADSMADLLRETVTRTGGQCPDYNWPAIVTFSQQYPALSRVSGVFATEAQGLGALLAFAWGRNHGDHVDYAVAASTRRIDRKIPLGYAPAWDLICWAKKNGATWFDFGGVMSGAHGSDDPLGGISDFKRYFGGQVVTVGEEWVLEPHPLQAKVANVISFGAAWTRKIFRLR